MIKSIPPEVIKLSKVTAKYQVTIPVKVRKELGILPGTEVDIAKEGRKYVIVVDPIETVKRKWRGRFRGGLRTMEYMDEVRGEVN
ncbi:MAG: AbrB/MazE/SpoVT family DNA-binding domain-containing protein [Deltaproteobacteria bacterium]|nr:AbrB/MazE/SpoVT family DNA-binding domain-containing protein [Deltaproteobacteria bacterium]MBW2119032.1 AbrB/MazE/SpoVT family DNA-binding domain-containing protein [Deltaproteobacteria bacterium]MBW2344228.1 AbrB/MazE/SpoVT family DNA-binding domain-containing protein [Deltaproteobacteria bacterium]